MSDRSVSRDRENGHRRYRSPSASPKRRSPGSDHGKRSRSRSRGQRSRSRDRSRRGSGSRDRSRSPASNTIAIFNLPARTENEELSRIFERYGTIEKCNVVTGRRRDQITGYAFITFESRKDAGEAKNDAHGMDIDGRTIRTDYCISKSAYSGRRREFHRSRSRESRRQRSRSRSRDRRPRYRSRSRENRRRSRSRSREYRRRDRSMSYDRRRR